MAARAGRGVRRRRRGAAGVAPQGPRLCRRHWHPGPCATGRARGRQEGAARRRRGPHGDGRQHHHGPRHCHRVRHLHRRRRRHGGPQVPQALGDGDERGAAQAAGAGALVAGRQAHPRDQAQGAGRDGRGDGRRHQRRAGAQGGRRGLFHGHLGHRGRQGGVCDCAHGRQLCVHHHGAEMGPCRQRRGAKVSAVSNHRQHHRRSARLYHGPVQFRDEARAPRRAAALG